MWRPQIREASLNAHSVTLEAVKVQDLWFQLQPVWLVEAMSLPHEMSHKDVFPFHCVLKDVSLLLA